MNYSHLLNDPIRMEQNQRQNTDHWDMYRLVFLAHDGIPLNIEKTNSIHCLFKLCHITNHS